MGAHGFVPIRPNRTTPQTQRLRYRVLISPGNRPEGSKPEAGKDFLMPAPSSAASTSSVEKSLVFSVSSAFVTETAEPARRSTIRRWQ